MEPTIRKGEQSPEDKETGEVEHPEFPEDNIEPASAGDSSNVDGDQSLTSVQELSTSDNDLQTLEENPPQSSEELVSLDPGDQTSQESQNESSDETAVFQTAEEDQPEIDDETQSFDTLVSADQVEQSPGRSPIESSEQSEFFPSLQPEQPIVEDEPEFSTEPVLILREQESPTAQNQPQPFTTDFLPIPTLEEVPQEANPRKVALVLSGGGARGAFQVGAEKYAREVKGYQWDIIAGVSVGAMNGAMLAMHRYTRLMQLWDNVSDKAVYTGGFNLISLIKILFGAKSFYGNEPLQRMMAQEFEAGQIFDDLHVGAVSLTSGEYVQFTKESLELSKAILASASIPVVWPPVDVSEDHQAMVDGGVRNITPIGDVLEHEPDEIVIINCGNQNPPPQTNSASTVLSIGLHALDIMQNEIFVNDMKQFLRINSLVKEAEQLGCVLHHPKTSRPYKYYSCQVIEPDIELGEVLDFSQKSVQASLKAGVRRAREVLGRP
jgi:NTE family protein